MKARQRFAFLPVSKARTNKRNRRGRDHITVVFTISAQSMPITIKVVSSNSFNCEVCSIHHYVIKCVSDIR